ncbi:MAG: polysaccharide transporter PST family [Gallionellaceae bacterium]|nr:MAG: polysaccharide transporter PST family [Gallionellaceae bacterium]
MTSANQGLLHRSLHALKWNYLGALVRAGAQFVLGIVLARMLGPEPFGLVAIAWLILSLGNLVADFGLAAALVQKKTISGRDIRYVFTLQMLAGMVMASAIVLAAPWIAGFFNNAEAVPVLRAMGCLFVVQAAGQTATALLRREMDFKPLQMYGVGSYLFSYAGIGLPLAWGGAGVWSLVAAQASQAVIYSVAVNLHVRHSWRPAFKADAGGMALFGSKIMASNLTSWSISNLDSTIVGRVFGTVDLGLYNRGMNLVSSPMNAFTSTLQGVLFPAYSRANGDVASARRAYLASVGLIAALLVPAFAAVAAIPDTVIAGMYGEQWMRAAALLTPLALAMPVNAVLAVGGPLMSGLGAVGRDAAAQAACAVILAGAVWQASHVSLETVAWAVLGVYLLRAALISHLALGLVAGTWRQVARALIGPLALGLLAALLARSADGLLVELVSGPLLRLCVDIGFTGGVIGILLLWFGRYLLAAESVAVAAKIAAKLPAPFAACVRKWEPAR